MSPTAEKAPSTVTARDPSGVGDEVTHDAGHLACPFCGSYDVDRLYLASVGLDSCVCTACSARWDEDAVSGEYRGRASASSVVAPRET